MINTQLAYDYRTRNSVFCPLNVKKHCLVRRMSQRLLDFGYEKCGSDATNTARSSMMISSFKNPRYIIGYSVRRDSELELLRNGSVYQKDEERTSWHY